MTYHGSGTQVQEQTASKMLQFAAQPSDSLPSFITSFSHPVHVDSVLSETVPDSVVDDGSDSREMDVRDPTRTTVSAEATTGQP